MDPTTLPADFKSFYRSLDRDQKVTFAAEAGTSTRYIETHLVYARKIPGPTRMEKLYAACVQFGATFTKAQLIAFFYEPNKDREIRTKDVIENVKASDDAQPPVGGSSDKKIEMRMQV
jgi:hypothetical protein